MKYIEELKYGQIFEFNSTLVVLTNDYRIRQNKTQHKCVLLTNGSAVWYDSDTIVEQPPVFYQDKDNNLKEINYVQDI